MKPELKPTVEDIMAWSKEIELLMVGEQLSEEMWEKIQYVAAYVFHVNQMEDYDHLNQN